ncbi:hypothetical protein CPB85DRAFT_1440512 [Mucidula mucida]|nr:hypothetical protein CPB85DRAFT_1440512 [Mucidula mucida]
MPPHKSQSSSLELPPKMQLHKKQESQLYPGCVANYNIQDDPQSTKTIGDKLGEHAEKKVEKAVWTPHRHKDVDRMLTANHPPPAAIPKPSKQPGHCIVGIVQHKERRQTPHQKTVNHTAEDPLLATPLSRLHPKSSARQTPALQKYYRKHSAEVTEEHVINAVKDSGDNSDKFIPPASEDKGHGNKQGGDADGMEEEAVKTQGKKGSVCAIIIANACTTNNDVGTPIPRATAKEVKEVKIDKAESLATKFEKMKRKKETNDKDPLAKSTSVDKDSLVNVGASIVGDNKDNHNEYVDTIVQPKDSKLIVKITAGQGPKNAKEAKGGKKKWDLSHLPSGAVALFKTTTLLEIRRAILTMTAPWSLLEMETVQEIVNGVYGAGKYAVGAQGSFVSLSNYRCNDFQHDIPDAAAKAVGQWMIESEETLNCKDDIADYAKWLITYDDLYTALIHWQTWGEGVQRKGPLQHYLILQTLIHAYYLGVPNIKDVETADRPIGLLLLAKQAIVRELSMWVTGKRELSSVPPLDA